MMQILFFSVYNKILSNFRLPWLVYGFLCNLVVFYIYGFPKKVKKLVSKDVNQEPKSSVKTTIVESNNDNENESNRLKKIKLAILKFLREFKTVLTNMPFVCLTLASTSEGLLLKGFLNFISLFFQYQYQISSTNSTIITGAIAIFSVILTYLSSNSFLSMVSSMIL